MKDITMVSITNRREGVVFIGRGTSCDTKIRGVQELIAILRNMSRLPIWLLQIVEIV